MRKIALLSLTAALFAPQAAEAQNFGLAFTADTYSTSFSALYGGPLHSTEGSPTYYQFGMGARGGYTFHNQIYFGGSFQYFTGEKAQGGFARVGSAQVKLEAGFDLPLSVIVLRPKVGVGYLDHPAYDSLLFSVGSEALYSLNKTLFVAGQLEFNVTTELMSRVTVEKALAGGVGIGARF